MATPTRPRTHDVACPRCGWRAGFVIARRRVICPRCQQGFRLADGEHAAAVLRPPAPGEELRDALAVLAAIEIHARSTLKGLRGERVHALRRALTHIADEARDARDLLINEDSREGETHDDHAHHP